MFVLLQPFPWVIIRFETTKRRRGGNRIDKWKTSQKVLSHQTPQRFPLRVRAAGTVLILASGTSNLPSGSKAPPAILKKRLKPHDSYDQ